jgi:hypothetical protein
MFFISMAGSKPPVMVLGVILKPLGRCDESTRGLGELITLLVLFGRCVDWPRRRLDWRR